MKFGKKNFVNLTEESPDIKNYRRKEVSGLPVPGQSE